MSSPLFNLRILFLILETINVEDHLKSPAITLSVRSSNSIPLFSISPMLTIVLPAPMVGARSRSSNRSDVFLLTTVNPVKYSKIQTYIKGFILFPGQVRTGNLCFYSSTHSVV